MEVTIIEQGKKQFLNLLLLADETEEAIDLYLDRGTLFALHDDGLKGVCVVTDEGGGEYEIQNLAIAEAAQRRGYGRYLIDYICRYYKDKALVMLVGTGDTPAMVSFYENSGFVFSHRIVDYMLAHYEQPIYEDGVQVRDKVYFKRTLAD